MVPRRGLIWPARRQGEFCMTRFRHLTWMLIAAVGFVFAASQSHAQKRPDADEPGLVADDGYELEPEFKKQVVYYRTSEAPGTIIVATGERHLYLVQGNGRAIRYGIGVGREGFQWQGLVNITRKAERPDWTPPPEMIQRQPYLPRFMAGGPCNPLGARAMYLDTTDGSRWRSTPGAIGRCAGVVAEYLSAVAAAIDDDPATAISVPPSANDANEGLQSPKVAIPAPSSTCSMSSHIADVR